MMENGHVQSNFKARSPWLPTVKPNLKTQLNLQTMYADTCIYKIQFILNYQIFSDFTWLLESTLKCFKKL